MLNRKGQPKQTKHKGPPKGDAIPREAMIGFFLTHQAARWWADAAVAAGFSSRSQLFTAIAESLQFGGFSGATGAALCFRLQNRLQRNRHKPEGFSMRFSPGLILQPLPHLPEDFGELTPAQRVALRAAEAAAAETLPPPPPGGPLAS